MSADKSRLVYSILRFLQDQKAQLSEDQGESLEVIQQCLETVYDVRLDDPLLSVTCQRPLNEIFAEDHKSRPLQIKLTQEQRDQAEQHKTKGNELMVAEFYTEALACYTQAINIDNNNPVYYCNRAAAFSRLEDHESALADCETAVTLDPGYSKAHGRKGLVHSALGEHKEAALCFEKGVELDPENETFKHNLELAQQKVHQMPAAGAGSAMPGGLNLGGMDFSSLLANPALMNMASSMFTNPDMQNMMSNMMGGAGAEPRGTEGLSGLLQAGQQLAEQMQQANPDLVSQLRTQMREEDGDAPPAYSDAVNYPGADTTDTPSDAPSDTPSTPPSGS